MGGRRNWISRSNDAKKAEGSITRIVKTYLGRIKGKKRFGSYLL